MLKVMTYNVHSCIDAQRNNSLPRIAEFIRQERPVIVGMNEIETMSPRTLFANQPKKLARAGDMEFAWGPTLRLGPLGFFGNALLSRYPICDTVNHRLPGDREPRCCLRAKVVTPYGLMTVMVTHLGLNRQERTMQIAELTRIVAKQKYPVILMGDFNCGIDQLKPLDELLQDTGRLVGGAPTYPNDKPTDRIDYILASREISCCSVAVPYCDASDHLPLTAGFEPVKDPN